MNETTENLSTLYFKDEVFVNVFTSLKLVFIYRRYEYTVADINIFLKSQTAGIAFCKTNSF